MWRRARSRSSWISDRNGFAREGRSAGRPLDGVLRFFTGILPEGGRYKNRAAPERHIRSEAQSVAHPARAPGFREDSCGCGYPRRSMSTTDADDPTLEARPISVECDWCGQKLEGRIRRGQVGRMVVIQAQHRDRAGRSCLGSGRTIGAWPLSVELRSVDDAYEMRIGGG